MGSQCCKCKCANGKAGKGSASSSASSKGSRNDRRLLGDRFHVARKDGHAVQLSLTRVSRDDSGRYTLTASNSSGESRAGYDLRVDSRMSMSDSLSVPTHDDAPHFLRSLADLAVKVGTRTRFLVEIRSPSDLKVTWLRNDRPVKETDRFQFLNEGNFWCVDVGPVMVEDHGRWTCVAENDAGRSACACQLSVLVPKAYKGPEFLEELRALLTEQGTVSLECKVVGVPTPALRWYKDAKEIRAGDVFALTADASDPTSLGTYTCEAVNCMGRAYSSSRVHVVGRGSREGSLKPADCLLPTGPPPTFDEEISHEKARIGDSLTLSCHVQVPPWPKSIQWYNSEGRVETGERYRILEDGLGGYSVEISALEACDDGEWKCVATSFEGVRGISTAVVTMTYPKNYRKPRFLESLRAILTEEGLVSFECKVVGFPTPQLRWFKDGQELRPGDVYQLTGTNSLGSYCCIARNCMGEASSTAELTVEDIQSQLSEEERLSLFSSDSVPHFVRGLRSQEARVGDNFRFTVQVSVAPEPKLEWFRDDDPVVEGDKFRVTRENLGTCHLDIRPIDVNDQAEWKCVATNDFGHSVTSCFLKLTIPKHFKKPRFLECLRAVLSEEGAVNLECKVIGVPQPVLKWYKDGEELKPGDIHRIISGQDGTCCLGTYTCEATNCMGTVSSSASLVGFEERGSPKSGAARAPQPIVRDPSLSTIHEERTSQMHDAEQSLSLDERGEVSFSFDGKEVSVSLYETPDLTEEEALQVVEMYADELSEHISEHNIVELPPLRFMKESSTSGNLLMEAVLVDVSPDYFGPAGEEDLRTDADMDEFSISDEAMTLHTPNEDEDKSERLDSEEIFDRALEPLARSGLSNEEIPPKRPPRKTRKDLTDSKSGSKESRSIEEKSDSYSDAKGHSLEMDTSYKSANENMENLTDENMSGKASKRKSSASDESSSKLRKSETGQLQKSAEGKDTSCKTESKTPQKGLSKLGKRGRTTSVESNSVTEDDTIYEDNIPKKPQLACIDALVPEYQTGQISVLDSLSHSLQSIQNGLMLVENQVASQSIDNKSAKESFEILDDLSQSLQDIQRGLSLIEQHIDEESVVPPGQTEMSILETLAQPLQEFQQKLALVEQQSVLGGTEETLLERTTHSIMESVSQPMQEFQREMGLIHQRAALGMGEDFVTERLQILCVPSGRSSAEEVEAIGPKRTTVDESEAKMKASLSLQTLAEPVTELLNALEKFQSDVVKVDGGDILSDKPKFASLEKLLYPMKVLKTEIELIEQQAITEADASLIQGKSLSILEAVSQPMDELRRGIALVEQRAVLDAGQEFCSVSVLENLEKPIRRLKRGLNQIQQQVSLEASLESIPQSYDISVLQGLEISLHNLKRVLSALQKKCAAQQSEEVFHLFEVCTLFEPLDNLSHAITRASESILTESTDSSSKPSIASLDCITSPLNELNKGLLHVEERFFPGNVRKSTTEQKSVAELVQSPLKALQEALAKAGREVCVDQSTDEELNPETTPALLTLVPAVQNLENYLGSLLTQLRRPKETDEISLAESLETLQSLFKCAYEVENSVSQIRRLAMKKVPQDKTGALVLGSLKEPFHELGTKLIEKQQGLLLQPGDLTLFVKPLDVDLQTLFPQFDTMCEALNDVQLFAALQDVNATPGKHFLNLKDLNEPITQLIAEVVKTKSDVTKTAANSTNYPLLQKLVPPMQKLTAALLKLEGAYTEISGPAGVASEIYVDAMKQTSITLRSLFEQISLLPEPGFEGLQSKKLKDACLNLIQPLAGVEFLVQKLSSDLETDINPTSLHNSLTQISKAMSVLSNEINSTTNELEEKLIDSGSTQPEIVHTILSSFCDVQRAVRATQVQIAMESGEEDLGNSLTPQKFVEINDSLRDLKSNLQSFEIVASAKSKEIVVSHAVEMDSCLSKALQKIEELPKHQSSSRSPFADWNSIFGSIHSLKPHFTALKNILSTIRSKLENVPEGQPVIDRTLTINLAENLRETQEQLGKLSLQIISAQGHVPQLGTAEKLLFTANDLKNHIATLQNVINTKFESDMVLSSSEASYLCTLLSPLLEFTNGIEQVSTMGVAMDQSSMSVPQLQNLQDSVCELQVALDSFKSLVPSDDVKTPGSQIIFETLSEPLQQLNNGLSHVCEATGKKPTASILLLQASIAQPLEEMISALEYETERLTHIVDSYVPETDRDIKKSQITLPVEGFKAKIKNMHTAISSGAHSDGEAQVATLNGLTQCVREFRQLAGAVQSEVAKMCEPIQISNKGSLPLLQNLQQTVKELQTEATNAVSIATIHLENAPVSSKESAVLLEKIINPVSDFLQSLSHFENDIISENDMVPLAKSTAPKSLVEPLSSMKQVLLNIGREISENAVHENIAVFQRPIQDLQRGIALIEEEIFLYTDDSLTLKDGVSILDTLSQPIQAMKKEVLKFQADLIKDSGVPKQELVGPVPSLKVCSSALHNLEKAIIASEETPWDKSNLSPALYAACNVLSSDVLEPLKGLCYWTTSLLQQTQSPNKVTQDAVEVLEKPLEDVSQALLKATAQVGQYCGEKDFASVQNVLGELKQFQKNVEIAHNQLAKCKVNNDLSAEDAVIQLGMLALPTKTLQEKICVLFEDANKMQTDAFLQKNYQAAVQHVSRASEAAQNQVSKVLPTLDEKSAFAFKEISNGLKDLVKSLSLPGQQERPGLSPPICSTALEKLTEILCDTEKNVLSGTDSTDNTLKNAVKQLEWSLKLIHEEIASVSTHSSMSAAKEEFVLKTISESLHEFSDQLIKLPVKGSLIKHEKFQQLEGETHAILESVSESIDAMRKTVTEKVPVKSVSDDDSQSISSVVQLLSSPLEALWSGVQQIKQATQEAIPNVEPNVLLEPVFLLKDTLLAMAQQLRHSDQCPDAAKMLEPSIETIETAVVKIEECAQSSPSGESSLILEAIATPLKELRQNVAHLQTTASVNDIAQDISKCVQDIQSEVTTAKMSLVSDHVSAQKLVVSALEGLEAPLNTIQKELTLAVQKVTQPSSTSTDASPLLVPALQELSQKIIAVKSQIPSKGEEKILLQPIEKIQDLVFELQSACEQAKETTDVQVLSVVAESLHWLRDETKLVLCSLQNTDSAQDAQTAAVEAEAFSGKTPEMFVQASMDSLLSMCLGLTSETNISSVQMLAEKLVTLVASLKKGQDEVTSEETNNILLCVQSIKDAIAPLPHGTQQTDNILSLVQTVQESINELISSKSPTATNVNSTVTSLRTSLDLLRVCLNLTDVRRENTSKCIFEMQTLLKPIAYLANELSVATSPTTVHDLPPLENICASVKELKKTVSLAKGHVSALKETGIDIAKEFLKPLQDFELSLQTIEEDYMRKENRGDSSERIKETIIKALCHPLDLFQASIGRAKKMEALKVTAESHAPLVQEISDHVENIRAQINQAANVSQNIDKPDVKTAVHTMQTLELPLQSLVNAITEVEDHKGPKDEAVQKVVRPLHELSKAVAVAQSLMASIPQEEACLVSVLKKPINDLHTAVFITEEAAKNAVATGEQPLVIQDTVLDSLGKPLQDLEQAVVQVNKKMVEAVENKPHQITEDDQKLILRQSASIKETDSERLKSGDQRTESHPEVTCIAIQGLLEEISNLPLECVSPVQESAVSLMQQTLEPFVQPFMQLSSDMQKAYASIVQGSTEEHSTLKSSIEVLHSTVIEVQAKLSQEENPECILLPYIASSLDVLEQTTASVAEKIHEVGEKCALQLSTLNELSNPVENLTEKIAIAFSKLSSKQSEPHIPSEEGKLAVSSALLFVDETVDIIKELQFEVGSLCDVSEEDYLKAVLAPLLQPIQDFEQSLILVKQTIQNESASKPLKLIVETLADSMNTVQRGIKQVHAEIKEFAPEESISLIAVPLQTLEAGVQSIIEGPLKTTSKASIETASLNLVTAPLQEFKEELKKVKTEINVKIAKENVLCFVENATNSIQNLEKDLCMAMEAVETGQPLDTTDAKELTILQGPLNDLFSYVNELKENVLRVQVDTPQKLTIDDVSKPLQSLQLSLKEAESFLQSESVSDNEKCADLLEASAALQKAVLKVVQEAATLEDPTVMHSIVINELSMPLQEYCKEVTEIKSAREAAQVELAKVNEATLRNATKITEEVNTLLSLPIKIYPSDHIFAAQNATKTSHIVIENLLKPLKAIQLLVEQAKTELQEETPGQHVTAQDLKLSLQSLVDGLDQSHKTILDCKDQESVQEKSAAVRNRLSDIGDQLQLKGTDGSIAQVIEEIVGPIASLTDLMSSVVLKEAQEDKVRALNVVTATIQEIKNEANLNLSELSQDDVSSVNKPVTASSVLSTIANPLSNLQAIVQKGVAHVQATDELELEPLLEIAQALKPLENVLASAHQMVVQNNSLLQCENVTLLEVVEKLQDGITTAETSLQSNNASEEILKGEVFENLAESLCTFTAEIKQVREKEEQSLYEEALNVLKNAISCISSGCKDSIPLITDGPLQVKGVRYIQCFSALQVPFKNLTELLQSVEQRPQLITESPQHETLASTLKNLQQALAIAESEAKEAPPELSAFTPAITAASDSLLSSLNKLSKSNTLIELENIAGVLTQFASSIRTTTQELQNQAALAMAESTLLAVDELANIANGSIAEAPAELGLRATVIQPLNQCLVQLGAAVKSLQEISDVSDETTLHDDKLTVSLSNLRESLAAREQFLMDQTIESLGDLASLVVPLHDLQTSIKSILKEKGDKLSTKESKEIIIKFAGPFLEFSKLVTDLKKAEDNAVLAEALKTTDLEHASLVDCALKSIKEVNNDMADILNPSRDLKAHFIEASVLTELSLPMKELDRAVSVMKEVDRDRNRVEALLTPLQNLLSLVNDLKDDIDSKPQEDRLLIDDLLVPLSQLSWSVTFIEENALLKREIGENPVVIENTILKSILEPLAEFKSKINKVKGKLQSKIRSKCDLATSLINTIDTFTETVENLDKGEDLRKVNLPLKTMRDGATKIKEDILQSTASEPRDPKQLAKPVKDAVKILNDITSLTEDKELLTEHVAKLSNSLSQVNNDVTKMSKGGEKPWNIEDCVMENVQNALKMFVKCIENLAPALHQQSCSVEDVPTLESESFLSILPEGAVAHLVSATDDLTKELARIEVNVVIDQTSEMPEKTRQAVLETLQEPAKELSATISKVAEMLACNETVTEDQVKDIASRIRDLHEGLEEIEQEVVLEQIKEGAVNLSMLQAIIRPIEQLNTCVALFEDNQVYQLPRESVAENEATFDFSTVSQPVKELSECLAVVEESIVHEHLDSLPVSQDQQVLYALANPIQELKSGLELVAKAQDSETTIAMQKSQLEQLLKLAKPIQEIQVAIQTVDNEEELETQQLEGGINTALLKALAEPLQVLGHKIAVIEHQQVMEANICSESGTDISKHSTVVSVVEVTTQGEQAIIHKQVLLEADGGSLDNSSSVEPQQAQETETSLRAVGVIEVQDTVEAEASLKLRSKKQHDQIDAKNASDSLGMAVYADSGVLMSSRRDESSSEMHDEPETLSDIESIPEMSKPETPRPTDDECSEPEVTAKATVTEVKAKMDEEAQDMSQKDDKDRANAEVEENSRAEAAKKAKEDVEKKLKREDEEKVKAEAEEKKGKDEAEKAQKEAEENAKKEAAEKAKQEAEAKLKKEAEEKAKLEAEEKARKDAEEKTRKAAEEKAKKDAEEKAKKEAEEKAKSEAEEKAKKEAEETAKKEAAEKLKLEADAKLKKEAEEKEKLQAEEMARKEAEEKAQKAAEEKAKKEAEEKAKKEADEKAKSEAEVKAKLETEAEAKKEAEEVAKKEAVEVAKKEAEGKARTEAEEKAKETAAKLKKEVDEKAKLETEEKARKEAEENVKTEAEAKAKKDAEEKAKKETEEKERIETEGKTKKEAEENAKREAEEKARKEAEEQAKQEAEERSKKEADAKLRKEAEEKVKLEAEDKLRKEAEQTAKKEAEQKAKSEAEAKAKKEAEESAKREAEEKAKKEAEEKAKKEAEEKSKQESEAKLKREAEEKAKLEAEDKLRKEAEQKAKKEAEQKAKKEAEEKAKKEAEESAKREAEEKAKKEAEEKAKKEAEEKSKQESEAKLKREAEEKAKLEAEDKLRKEAEQKAKKEAEQKAKKEAEEKAKKEAEESAKREAEEKAKKEAEEKAKKEAKESAKREAEEKAKKEAEEKAKKEAEEKAKKEAEEKAKKEAEEKSKQESEAKLKREAEEKAKLEAEDKLRKEAEQKAKKEAEQKAKKEAEEKAKKEAEESAKREAEEKAKKEAEDKAKKEAEEKSKKESEAKLKKQAEEKAKLEAEEKLRKEAEQKAKKEAEQKAKIAAEEKTKKEAEEMAKKEAEEKAKKEAEEKAKKEAEEKAKKQAEEKAKKEAEEKAKKEAEEKAKKEAEEKAKKEAEEKAKKEAEEKAKKEAEAKARKEAEEKAKKEAEEKAKKEAEEKAKKEAEAKARKEAEEKAKKEAEEKAKKEAEEKAKKEADEKTKNEAEAKLKKETEEKAKLEAEEKLRKEAEQKAQREAEENAKREADEKAKIEAEEKAKKEAEEKSKKESEAKLKKEAEEKAKLEAEEKLRNEAEQKAKREAEEKTKKEAEEKAKIEAEEKAKKDADEKAKKEADEKAKREADEKAKKKVDERAKKGAEETAKKEAGGKAKKVAEENAKQEAESKLKKEADERLKFEAEEKTRKEAKENMQAEEKTKVLSDPKSRKVGEPTRDDGKNPRRRLSQNQVTKQKYQNKCQMLSFSRVGWRQRTILKKTYKQREDTKNKLLFCQRNVTTRAHLLDFIRVTRWTETGNALRTKANAGRPLGTRTTRHGAENSARKMPKSFSATWMFWRSVKSASRKTGSA
ncbi:titin homolog isoform X2 [Thrips palmi]|uniref:Titin homolog isoform X2 n=1 Tax=Thrips palmi TaxID=161013 RepID=A0A6P9AC33_THRPL|nr:titin homolog isoform X2 [Thrips palmi]